jgi:hypothetical protein
MHHYRRSASQGKMKPRHAATLPLVGWHLMVPPSRTCPGRSRYFQPDPLDASLDKWQMVDTFDTVAECKKDLLEYLQKARECKDRDWPAVHYVASYGRCIASDDPRSRS